MKQQKHKQKKTEPKEATETKTKTEKAEPKETIETTET
jgi:hypothetical protein